MNNSSRIILAVALLALVCCNKGKPASRDTSSTPAPGRVVLTSEPTSATVIINDDERKGKTPLTLKLRAFTRLRFQVVKEGFQNFRGSKIIEPGTTVKIHAKLLPKQGVIDVKAMLRGAKVYVDGKHRGETPVRLQVAADREHQVEVKMRGMQPFRHKVKLGAGEEKKIMALLVPEGAKPKDLGWLSVETDIPAIIYLGQMAMGSTPLEKMPLPARKFQIRVANPKKKLSKSLTVTVKPGKHEHVKIKLVPAKP